jgi:glycosyltransferase involved in cell wall biosynthesis
METIMKILYDHLCFKEKYGGVSKYFVLLIKNLPPEIQWQISVKFTNNEYIKSINNLKTISIFNKCNFVGKGHLISFMNKPFSINAFKKDEFDIYHQTHYDPYAYSYLKKKKSVTTIHDMNFYKIPKLYKKNYLYKEIIKHQKDSAIKADKIITISNNTKKDIMDIWNIPGYKINTIYHGIEDIGLEKYNKDKLFDKPYILFVGMRSNYKNFHNYLKVFQIISEEFTDLLLICTGIPFSSEEKKIIYSMNLVDKVYQISASEKNMVSLYYNAELFAYPSYYEGFGMPLLEAMSCHCPVICSNTSCFPEIAQNAALYFDPYSIESMVYATRKVLMDDSLRSALINKGIQQVHKESFSWKKCAYEHVKVYKDLLDD